MLRFFSRCTVHMWLFSRNCNWYFLWQIWHSNFGSEVTCFVNKCRVMDSLFGYSLPQKWHIKFGRRCFRLCWPNIARVWKLRLQSSHLSNSNEKRNGTQQFLNEISKILTSTYLNCSGFKCFFMWSRMSNEDLSFLPQHLIQPFASLWCSL